MTYEYDQQFVDGVLFGERTCTGCGLSLPKTRDYFAADAHERDGLTRQCRSCRNAQLMEHQRQRREAAKKITQERSK